MAPRKLTKIADYPINTLVRIAATGGQSGDWWQRVALTGTSQILRSYQHTVIQVINPDTGEVTQQPWRTEWLEVLPEGEQLEEVKALQRAIARAKAEYSDSAKEQEQLSSSGSDIPESSISVEQQEVPMVNELPPQSESSESEAVVAAVEVVEELTEEEAADRHRLELTVERAFYQAGHALKELRERRLYRSTHKTWEAYCKDRFGYGRDSADLKILAAAVVDEISKMPTIRRQKMPTTLEQVRHLTKLQPDEQREVWQQAVEQAKGRVPSGRAVKSIVERLKERDTTPLFVIG